MQHTRALTTIAATMLAASALPFTTAQAQTVQSEGQVQYLCGGVGEGSRQALQAQASNFNLGFWMVKGPRGEYLADVPIKIKKGGETVASFTADGPLCYVKVPGGTYTIEGQHDGQTRTIKARTGSMANYLRW